MARQRMTIEFEVVIEDEAALRAYAESRYRTCWGDAAWDDLRELHGGDIPTSVLAYEAMVASSECPAPSDMGVSLLDYWAHGSVAT